MVSCFRGFGFFEVFQDFRGFSWFSRFFLVLRAQFCSSDVFFAGFRRVFHDFCLVFDPFPNDLFVFSRFLTFFRLSEGFSWNWDLTIFLLVLVGFDGFRWFSCFRRFSLIFTSFRWLWGSFTTGCVFLLWFHGFFPGFAVFQPVFLMSVVFSQF